VNLSAPGFDFSKGSNTQQILLGRDGNSTVAAFYLRPHVGPNGEAAAPRETRILASLFHNDAFIARLTRPITIGSAQPNMPCAPMQVQLHRPHSLRMLPSRSWPQSPAQGRSRKTA
jgi:hypothetical protein